MMKQEWTFSDLRKWSLTPPGRIHKDSDPTIESPDKAVLEEQFQELPDDDEDPGIDDNIEELLGQPEVSKIADPDDTLSEESEEENEEQGMKIAHILLFLVFSKNSYIKY